MGTGTPPNLLGKADFTQASQEFASAFGFAGSDSNYFEAPIDRHFA